MNLQAKLHDAYEHLVDTIEHLVAKEGKTLQEAFAEGQKKLHELGDLTTEEIEMLSNHIQQRLHQLGREANEAEEAISEIIHDDVSYLSTILWDKLRRVADKTRLELEELSDGFKAVPINRDDDSKPS